MTESSIVDANSDLKHRVFPRPFERLSNLKDGKGLVGAEIGVCGGEHALSLLKTLKIDTLFLIDPYEMYEIYANGDGNSYGKTQSSLSDSFIQAKKLLKPFEENIQWVKKLSDDAVKDIHESLDFVYVDGNHDYEFVKNDIKNYYPLLKKGGVIGGHDFYNGFTKSHNGVVTALTEFSVSKNIQLFIEQPDWWLYKD